ncbi:hypothetical protein HKX48_006628 [Thoreauomyces humboldtii]|nr:hypothetical protein HKX48_006628 [Thoreauomyces humboldtii]
MPNSVRWTIDSLDSQADMRRNSTGTLGSITAPHVSQRAGGAGGTATDARCSSTASEVSSSPQMTTELLHFLAANQKHMAGWAESGGLPADSFDYPRRHDSAGYATAPTSPRPVALAQMSYHDQQRLLAAQYELQEQQSAQDLSPQPPSDETLYGDDDAARSMESSRGSPTSPSTLQRSPAHSFVTTSSNSSKLRKQMRLPVVNPHAIQSARNSLDLAKMEILGTTRASGLSKALSVPNLDDRYSQDFGEPRNVHSERKRLESDETLIGEPTFHDPDMYSAYEFLNGSRMEPMPPRPSMQRDEISDLVDKFPYPPPQDLTGNKSFALEQYQIMQAWGQKGKKKKKGSKAHLAAPTTLPQPSMNTSVVSLRDAVPQPSRLPTLASQLTPPASPPRSRNVKTVDEWLSYQNGGPEASESGYDSNRGSGSTTDLPLSLDSSRGRKEADRRMSLSLNWKRGRFLSGNDRDGSVDDLSYPMSPMGDATLDRRIRESPVMKKAVLNEILLDYTMTVNRLREPALDSQRASLRKSKSVSNLLGWEAGGSGSKPPSPPPELKARVPELPARVSVGSSKSGEEDDAVSYYADMMERMARPSLDVQRAAPPRTPRQPLEPLALQRSVRSYHMYTSDVVEVHPPKVRSAAKAASAGSKPSVLSRFLGRDSSAAASSRPRILPRGASRIGMAGSAAVVEPVVAPAAESSESSPSPSPTPSSLLRSSRPRTRSESSASSLLGIGNIRRRLSRSALSDQALDHQREADLVPPVPTTQRNVRSIFSKSVTRSPRFQNNDVTEPSPSRSEPVELGRISEDVSGRLHDEELEHVGAVEGPLATVAMTDSDMDGDDEVESARRSNRSISLRRAAAIPCPASPTPTLEEEGGDPEPQVREEQQTNVSSIATSPRRSVLDHLAPAPRTSMSVDRPTMVAPSTTASGPRVLSLFKRSR